MHPSQFGIDRSDEIRQLFRLSVDRATASAPQIVL